MLHQYQEYAVEWLVNRLVRQRQLGAGLFLDPGLGKTLISLSFFKRIKEISSRMRMLVVAPLRPVSIVWPAEIAKWGFGFSHNIIHGKKRALNLLRGADIDIINYESLAWLLTQNVRYDLVVLDEITKVKTWGAQRSKCLRKMLPLLGKRIGLTGTPVPNSYADLHSQLYCLDDGETLGKTVTYFRNTFCKQDTFLARKYNEWTVRDEKQQAIEQAIAPMVLRMSAEEYLDMPRLVHNDIWIELPTNVRSAYTRVEKDLFVHLESGESLTASSAAALYGLCRQIANGGGYDKSTGERVPVHVHDTKVSALEDLIEELQGKHVLVAYQFNHDLERLQRRWPHAPVIKGGVNGAETDRIVGEWNAKKIPVLLVQPQALSHGANLQEGGSDVVWFGLTDQREVYDQFNCRLYRQGQTSGQVRIHHILARETVEEAMVERLQEKGERQQSLLDSLAEYGRRLR